MSTDLRYPHWCIQGPVVDGITPWVPMWRYDSDMLEKSFLHSHNNETIVFVENRTCRADINQREVSSCYELDTPTRKLIRGTWFYYSASSKAFYPFNESVAARIESWFQGVKAAAASDSKESFRAEMEISVTLSHRPGTDSAKYRLQASREPVVGDSKLPEGLIDGFSVTMKSLSMSLNDIFTGTIQLQRGIAVPVDPEERWSGSDVNHLVFVVHGIGQSFFANTESSFRNNVASLRKLVLEQHEEFMVLEAAAQATTPGTVVKPPSTATSSSGSGKVVTPCAVSDSPPPPPDRSRMEFIRIDWFDVMRSAEMGLDDELAKVTMPNLQVVRQLANEVVLDVLLYLTPEFREKIITTVCERMNMMYLRFCENNPSFLDSGGKCSVVGHSLGTIILYDILACQTADMRDSPMSLAFRPQSFFALGSPLGLFLTIRNSAVHQRAQLNRPVSSSEDSSSDPLPSAPPLGLSSLRSADVPTISPNFTFPTCSRFYNIFHPHDPVAYRVEPLLDPQLQSRSPAIVPHHDGGFRVHYKIKNIATQLSDTFTSVLNPSAWFQSTVNTVAQQQQQIVTSASAPVAVADVTSSKRKQEMCKVEIPHVPLNGGRRIDFMLQETSLEGATEYIGTLTSHTGYFDMKDVARFIAVNLS
mmetsp:Transcript_16820/g.25291  ORF Transcript_16820/g.25291 Transcript_16820/m.25291 type:complete len:645 (-) Transcript_16820:185-2119(-)